MVEFRWIKTSLFLMPVLLFTVSAAVSGQSSVRVVVRVADEVTLPCENVIGYRDKCENTWLFNAPRISETVELIKLGQIGEKAKTKSDRLSVTQNCSLVIKKVTDEDVGLYTCRQRASGHGDSWVYLSVVTMTEHENNDEVTLSCSVLEYEWCFHRVEWLYEGKDKDTETSQRRCSDHFIYKRKESKNYKLFNCEVTDLSNGQVQQFPFSPQSSGKKTTTTAKPTATTRLTLTTTENNVMNSTGSKTEVWWFIIVAVGLAALLIIIVTVFLCKRTKGKKTRMDENTGQSLNPMVTESHPEITQDTDDPEDGVAYASISYTKKANSKTRVQVRSDDDEGDTVTYSTVRVFSSPAAAASADPNNLYTAINTPRK